MQPLPGLMSAEEARERKVRLGEEMFRQGATLAAVEERFGQLEEFDVMSKRYRKGRELYLPLGLPA